MMNRRSFLRHTALATGALSTGSLISPNLIAATGDNRKLNCVQIGCGGRGMNHLDWVVTESKENLVAIVDPDEKRHAAVKKWLEGKQQDTSRLQVFTDYRVMFDKIGKDIDAVFIATPNHHHAPATWIHTAFQYGLHTVLPGGWFIGSLVHSSVVIMVPRAIENTFLSI